MKILIVEDEEKLANAIKKGLEKVGYTADCVYDGETAERRILLHHDDYDLVILDLLLPKKNGFEICRHIREANVLTPILVLTARDITQDKILLLNGGADDYLTKPFSFDELVARIRALLRRPREALPSIIQIGDITLNPVERKVFRNNQEIPLTLKEFELLEYLMRHPNQALNREDILSHLWSFDYDAFSNVVDVHIKNLRKKLAFNTYGHGPQKLETIRGTGYRLKT